MTSEDKLAAINVILWPPEDPDQQWETGRDLSKVAEVIGEPSKGTGTSPADQAVLRIEAILYPSGDPDADWSADTIEDVGWVVEEYNNTQGKFAGMDIDEIAAMSKGNPARGGLVRGVITLGLAALGVTGIVMGIREAKRSW